MRPPCWFAVLALMCLSAPLGATPLELIANGDFEEDLTVGWFQRNDASSATILRTLTAHPDPDYEATLTVANGVGELGLFQRFQVPNLELTISADLWTTGDGTGGAWTVAGLMLTYRDRQRTALGNTAIVYTSRDCPWVDSPTLHIVYTGFETWETVNYELSDLLASLPGVDPAEIEWLDVEVMIVADNC
jgi:hypothetical protein